MKQLDKIAAVAAAVRQLIKKQLVKVEFLIIVEFLVAVKWLAVVSLRAE